MYEQFGEFDSAAEINRAAEGQKNEGDTEALIALAKENGIDDDDVYDYMDGFADSLCTELSAAVGKLAVEKADLKPFGIMTDWIDYIIASCTENADVARAVRKKGKSLKGCIAELLKRAYRDCRSVDSEICRLAGVTQNCKLGMPGMAEAKKIIREYYGGKS